MLFFWYTLSDDLVRTILEKVWLFPKEKSYLGEEAISIMFLPFRRYLSYGKVIDNFSISGFLKDC